MFDHLTRRHALQCAAVMAAWPLGVSGARASPGKTTAILSLVSPLSVVQFRSDTGTRLPVLSHTLATRSGALDRSVIAEAASTLGRLAPAVSPVLLASVARETQDAGVHLLEGDGDAARRLRDELARQGADRLLLFTGRRVPAAFKIGPSRVGSGTIQGLGIYVDNTKPSWRGAGRGFIAPFASLTATLFDLPSGAVLASADGVATRVFANSTKRVDISPWEAVSDEKKAVTLDALTRRAAQQAVDALAVQWAVDAAPGTQRS